MKLIETIAVAFSMYSAIPVPRLEWNERNMKYAMAAFPLVGLVTGASEWAALKAAVALNLPTLLRGAILCVIPVLITGGIHFDGYCDTCDALASHAAPEEKHAIMKDPHIGAFAAIHLAVYFVLSFALWACFPEGLSLMLLPLFCISRCLSGFSICFFPLAKDTGLAYIFAKAADRKRTMLILAVMLLLSAFAAVLSGSLAGAAAVTVALVMFVYYYFVVTRQFAGLSGDLAGWFLQKCELWMLAAAVITEVLRDLT